LHIQLDKMKNAKIKLIQDLYLGFLHRKAQPSDEEYWLQKLKSGCDISAITDTLIVCEEFKRIQKKLQDLFVAPGHFYSPIVNTTDAEHYLVKINRNPELLVGLVVDINVLLSNWKKLLPYLRSIPFSDEKNDKFYYFFKNEHFSYADGSILHAMLRLHHPRRLIEIGSGYSSACAVDTIDHFLDGDVQVTFIEPYPELLINLLGEERLVNCMINSVGVQQADPELFQTLESGDFLFIDSTHVMKTGSDVCHELFNILPNLKSGVFVHFHDIFWPFEYSDNWVVEQNRSWNELYGLRAFLMYNDAFKVEFFNDFFVKNFYELIHEDYPAMLKNSGGSIWLRKL
jgi:hypothetical protein